MSTFPTIVEVIQHLEANGQAAMALAVSRLRQSHIQLGEANQRNFEMVSALRARYEPKPFRYQNHTAPPESDG